MTKISPSASFATPRASRLSILPPRELAEWEEEGETVELRSFAFPAEAGAGAARARTRVSIPRTRAKRVRSMVGDGRPSAAVSVFSGMVDARQEGLAGGTAASDWQV